MRSDAPTGSAGARIISSSFDVELLAEHARCHTCADYLAEVASTAGADSALTGRELSACLFELLELARSHHGDGRVALTLVARDDGVEIRAVVPGDAALAARYDAWLKPDPDRDPLADPRPGDGVLELAETHRARLTRFDDAAGIGLAVHVPLERAAPGAKPEEEAAHAD